MLLLVAPFFSRTALLINTDEYTMQRPSAALAIALMLLAAACCIGNVCQLIVRVTADNGSTAAQGPTAHCMLAWALLLLLLPQPCCQVAISSI